jgi:hypothetical protein
MDFRERLEQSKKRASESDDFSCPYFSTQRGSNPTCLDLRLSAGIRKAMPYSFFTEMSFDNERGIEILTNGKRITITGRNLARLFDYLISYRVKFVQGDIGYDDPDEDGLYIEAIAIDDLL